MPQDPDAAFAPDVDIDDSQKYIAELLEIEERPSMSQYKKSDNEMTMIHKFRLFDMDDGVVVTDNNTGEPYVLWWFRKDTTYHNKSTGQIGESREVANALLDTELTDDDVRRMNQEGWDADLIGKRVVMDLEWYTNTKGYQRIRPIRVKPYRVAKKAAAAPGRRGPRRLDDDEQ